MADNDGVCRVARRMPEKVDGGDRGVTECCGGSPEAVGVRRLDYAWPMKGDAAHG